MSVSIYLVAPAFVGAFLGADWLPVMFTMQILVAHGLLRTLFAAFNSTWRAVGRPDAQAKFGFLRVALLTIAIVSAMSARGIKGTALAVTGILAFPMAPFYVREMKRTLDMAYRRFSRKLSYPVTVSGTMAMAVLAAQNRAGSPFVGLTSLVAIGVVAYVVSAASLTMLFDWRVKQNLREFVSVMPKWGRRSADPMPR